jgi:four helix bundle suffix protein
VNVARASLEELLLDYEDYLRHRRLPQWLPDGPEASEVRAVPRTFRKDPSDSSDVTDLSDTERWALYARWLDHADPAIRANATICLVHQANFLLDRQIAALEAAFVQDGGYSEQLATERLRHRKDQSDRPDPSDPTPPACPTCGALMALRTAKSGKTPGSQFWGCTKYPDCKGTAKI